MIWEFPEEMMYEIKKKLIHFYTHGNVAEDFVASRRAKVSKIRRIIRLSFYTHCGLALIGIVLSILLGGGLAVIATVLGAVVSCGLALLAVGDMKPLKEISCSVDLLLMIVWFVSGAFAERKSSFVVCGVIMTLCFFMDFAVLCAAWCRGYLENLNPLLVRREDYTLLRSLTDDSADEEPAKISLPPLTSEMRELARQMREVLREGGKSEKGDENKAEVTQ